MGRSLGEVCRPGADLATSLSQRYQYIVGLCRQFVPAEQLQTAIHQALRRQRRPLSSQPRNDVTHARKIDIAHLVSGEVNALDQGAAIDPLLTGMPAFHSGWVQDVLTHIANTQSQAIETGLGEGELTDQARGANQRLDRALAAGKAGVLEEGRGRQEPKQREYDRLK